MLLKILPVGEKAAVSLLLKVKPARVPVVGLVKLSCNDWNWKPKVREWRPLTHWTLFWMEKVLAASIVGCEFVPAQPMGALVPLKVMSGKAELARPDEQMSLFEEWTPAR